MLSSSPTGLLHWIHHGLRFGLVGVINTVVGYAVIYAAMLGLGWSAVASNVAGYAVGLCCSFLLNRRFTFASRARMLPEAMRFLFVFAVAWLLNLGVLLASMHWLAVPAVWAQLVAGAFYTCAFFLLSKLFVFRNARSD
ncbi:GtrA family protein [Pseudomarimonas salicorniae]|uniref:GtrA family protein n=1 Tax=Pseudomarimonas salicorniae TaxID=2933270 RepID=A0ABT0GH62_9GAMM|nr:GtrA family protein [Lysobacter sp. CAU 1642]MCK7593870.1 GtrA family protein [Lysobacter sp. CAU 1642]